MAESTIQIELLFQCLSRLELYRFIIGCVPFVLAFADEDGNALCVELLCVSPCLPLDRFVAPLLEALRNLCLCALILQGLYCLEHIILSVYTRYSAMSSMRFVDSRTLKVGDILVIHEDRRLAHCKHCFFERAIIFCTRFQVLVIEIACRRRLLCWWGRSIQVEAFIEVVRQFLHSRHFDCKLFEAQNQVLTYASNVGMQRGTVNHNKSESVSTVAVSKVVHTNNLHMEILRIGPTMTSSQSDLRVVRAPVLNGKSKHWMKENFDRSVTTNTMPCCSIRS